MITNIQVKPNEGIQDMWSMANEECKNGNKIENLILSGEFAISELECQFVKDNLDKAKIWQNTERPDDYKFTHGEFLNKYSKTAMDFLLNELHLKKDSNRACWSLIDMGTIIGSGDKPIPSFLILQAGVAEDNESFTITAYYRALEVHKFLPINLTEICIVANEINKKFASFRFSSFKIVIHAFNAYRDDNFDCLKKATIDSIEIIKMHTKICCSKNGKKWLQEILENKKDHNESNIEITGIKNLIACVKEYLNENENDQYTNGFLNALNQVEHLIKEHNNMSQISSYSNKSDLYIKIKSSIDTAIKLL